MGSEDGTIENRRTTPADDPNRQCKEGPCIVLTTQVGYQRLEILAGPSPLERMRYGGRFQVC